MMVTYTTEGFIRRAVSRVLGGAYRGRGVCASCLVGMALERLHTGWRRSEVEGAMEKVFKTPGPLSSVAIGPCARCRRSMPCLLGGRPGEVAERASGAA
ncbi:MAG: hypothetical protein ACHQ8D_11375 [Candidatus Rokuibacteriota bacterium]